MEERISFDKKAIEIEKRKFKIIFISERKSDIWAYDDYLQIRILKEEFSSWDFLKYRKFYVGRLEKYLHDKEVIKKMEGISIVDVTDYSDFVSIDISIKKKEVIGEF